jgi:prephenate dehydrogenase
LILAHNFSQSLEGGIYKLGFNKIFVAGLGLIGGSFAMALKNVDTNFNVIGFDKDLQTLEVAKERGAIDKSCVNPSEDLKECDLIVLALYPKATIKFIKENMASFKKGALIIDTAGIKEEVVREVQAFLREDLEFLGTHPMAGKAEGGFLNAAKDLFLNCKYIITPTDKNKKDNIEAIKTLIIKMCSAEIISVSPEEHDKIIAYTSQLPHVIAASIANCGNFSVDVRKFAGGSFRDMTRISTINAELWQELLINNRENILEVIEDFQGCIDVLKDAIEYKDKEKLCEVFEKSSNLKRGTK